MATYIEDVDAVDTPHAPLVKNSYGGRSLHEQSHGEAFLSLILHRLGGNGLYLFDEPEAALSPARQLTFLVRMHDWVESGSRLIIATHSPIIMGYPGATILQFTDRKLSQLDYEETEHFFLTREFLLNRDRVFGELFASE